jgi:peroxiredoxin Q/BCP
LTFADYAWYREVSQSVYGKTYMGAERTTFIIDSDGKVADVLRKVKPAEHDALVLAALERATPLGV